MDILHSNLLKKDHKWKKKMKKKKDVLYQFIKTLTDTTMKTYSLHKSEGSDISLFKQNVTSVS